MVKYVKVASREFAGAGFDFLDYSTGDLNLGIGDMVAVPFNNRIVLGYVINVSDRTEIADTKEVYEKIEDGNSFTPELLDLAVYVSKTFFCPLSRVIMSVLPPMLKNKVREYYEIKETEGFRTPKENEIIERISKNGNIAKPEEGEKRVIRSLQKKRTLVKKYQYLGRKVLPKMVKSVRLVSEPEKLTEAQKKLADYLKDRDFIPVSFLKKNKISTDAVINNLISKGVLERGDVREDRIPRWTEITFSEVKFTEDQQRAFDTINNSLNENKNDIFLLFGVTASGKTEVYIRLIEEVVKKNKTALVLLPEIALTTQVMNIFKSRFGKLAAVLHSGLSAGERLDEWDRIKNGRAKIVIGARSAVFAPLENIGLIVIDEEHDGGYKQDTQPKYNAKDLAIYRAAKNKGVCVFGSATPSVESYYKAKTGEYRLVSMPNRVTGRSLPSVDLQDMKGSGKDAFISPKLREKIDEKLQRGEQIILLQNRRAYSTYVMCPDCAWVAKCENCDVSLKFHFRSQMLVCHHCGYSIKKPTECPECHSTYLRAYGTGTQKVEEYLKYNFPEARVLRMDRDTTANKNALGNILSDFREHKADILVGTQMVAKGLDFPLVTLVGVINADADLNMPDFRSGERSFQLIEQVTGRAGRGEIPGEVIIQTYNPDNSVLLFAKEKNYEGFFENEIKSREMLMYPPFIRIIKASVQGSSMEECRKILDDFHREFERIVSEKDNIVLYPPMPAIVPRVNNVYKANMLIKTSDRKLAEEKIVTLLTYDRTFKKRILFDADPMFMD
ncbi:MAG: primosomal protein N' [Armatimonadetes bacterium]|nr:primosomal protein N' [Candidatus Hippobium faecium]